MLKKLLFVTFLLCAVSFVSADSWLLYSTLDLGQQSDIYVMKVDSLGNITMPPVHLFSPTDCFSCAGVMTDGDPGTIVLMMTSFDPSNPNYGTIRRSILDTTHVTATKPQKLGIYQSNSSWPISIQTTQHAPRRFMVTEVNDDNARAFGLTSEGLWDGAKWRANPRVSKGGILQVGVSPDGGMSFAANANNSNPVTKIYLQALRSDGLPTGSPHVGGSGVLPYGIDITNLLPGNVRYLLYNDIVTGVLNLTIVDGQTGAKLSPPRDLGQMVTPFVQGIAADPQGRFVVYSTYDTACGGAGLRFQALDGAGRANGPYKTIVPCVANEFASLPDLFEQ